MIKTSRDRGGGGALFKSVVQIFRQLKEPLKNIHRNGLIYIMIVKSLSELI